MRYFSLLLGSKVPNLYSVRLTSYAVPSALVMPTVHLEMRSARTSHSCKIPYMRLCTQYSDMAIFVCKLTKRFEINCPKIGHKFIPNGTKICPKMSGTSRKQVGKWSRKTNKQIFVLFSLKNRPYALSKIYRSHA